MWPPGSSECFNKKISMNMDCSLFNWCELFIQTWFQKWLLNFEFQMSSMDYIPWIWECLFIPLTKALSLVSPTKQALLWTVINLFDAAWVSCSCMPNNWTGTKQHLVTFGRSNFQSSTNCCILNFHPQIPPSIWSSKHASLVSNFQKDNRKDESLHY